MPDCYLCHIFHEECFEIHADLITSNISTMTVPQAVFCQELDLVALAHKI